MLHRILRKKENLNAFAEKRSNPESKLQEGDVVIIRKTFEAKSKNLRPSHVNERNNNH